MELYGGFLKWWYPQIIHFNGIFHYQSTIFGYPHLWKPVEVGSRNEESNNWVSQQGVGRKARRIGGHDGVLLQLDM
jgi:hypothetical protein